MFGLDLWSLTGYLSSTSALTVRFKIDSKLFLSDGDFRYF